MKFSEFFTAPFIRSFAIRIGIFIGILTTLFSGWKMGILIGAVSVLVISLILPVLFYFAFLPYVRMKQKFARPFLFDEPVRFTVKKGTVGGFFIITEKTLVFLSKECTSQTLELSRDEVKSVSLGKDLTVDIYLNNTQFIRVFSGACDEIMEILRTNGWNTVE
ncbi:MAG: hypothetical protein E7643_01905 [Ruminococcaceae bacterium]|nr:hypothetical protein [Oscillospiraceae bacterium]